LFSLVSLNPSQIGFTLPSAVGKVLLDLLAEGIARDEIHEGGGSSDSIHFIKAF